MPKIVAPLSVKALEALKHPGGNSSATFAVGGAAGLYLKINPAGGRSWILRARVGSMRHEIGLGAYPAVSLKEARDKAHAMRAEIEEGRNPLQERKARIAEQQARSKTFADAVAEFVDSGQLGHMRSEKHRAQWISELNRLADPILGAKPLGEIDTNDILQVLTQTHTNYSTGERGELWVVSHPSAKKLRQKLSKVLRWSAVKGYRQGANPAGADSPLEFLLPKHRHKVVSHPAVQIDDAPRWFAEVRRGGGMGHRALEFLALTGVRSGEVREARWDEIESDVWAIPAERMKMDSPHRVPLSAPALALLDALPRRLHSSLIFPGARGRPLSDMTLSNNMKTIHARDLRAGGPGFMDGGRPAVPHGLRSTFKDWAVERTDYPNEMSELGLAHKVGSEVERAYRRSDMLEKRRGMMNDWAAHLMGSAASVAANWQ